MGEYGHVEYDYQVDVAGFPIDDPEPPGPKWLVELLGAEYFQEVSIVTLVDTRVDGVVCDLTPLEGLNSVIGLDIISLHVSDLTPLAELESLQWLALRGAPVSDLTPLAGLKNLRWLRLEGGQVRDVTPLAKLTGLQEFYLEDTPVSEEQLEELRKALPNCRIE